MGVYKTGGAERPCTHIGWADGGDFFVCSYISYQTGGSHDAYIWDPEYQNVPVYTLKSSKPAPCLEFNPKDIHTLASGLHSGQIAVWDTRADNEPVRVTDRDCSHRSQANCLKWCSTKTSSEFFTGSAEGDVFWWDFRKLDQPVDELLLDPNKRTDRRSFGISVLEYESSMPTKFMAGSEQGVLFSCNKKGKTLAEKITATFQCHYGPIYSLERNTTFLKNFLTVGDWQAKIWTDECKEDAIVWSKSQKHALTSGCWSPTRCSTFFLTRMDGIFEIWDLLLQQNDQIFKLKISDHPILCSRLHKTGRWLAMGTENGDVYQAEITENLAQSSSSDRAAFLAMLERETKRERLLESKHREVKLKDKESERVRLLREEAAIENAVAEEVLVHHAETAFLQHLSGEAEPEKAKTLLGYMDAENEEILEGRSHVSRKFRF
jgi:dynein intermediate chain 2, axonemal